MISKLKKLNRLFTKRVKIKFAGLFLLVLVGTGLELLGIGAIPAFLSILVSPKSLMDLPVVGSFFRSLNITGSRELVIFSGLALLVVYLIKNSYISFLSYVRSRFIRNRIVELGRRMFSVYLYAPYAFHLDRNTEELKRNANLECRFIGNQVLGPLLNLILATITVLAIVILLLVVEPLVSLIVIGVLGAASLLFTRLTHQSMQSRGEQEQNQRTISYKLMQEAFGSLKSVKLGHKQPFFIRKFVESYRKANEARQIKAFVSSLSRPSMEVIAVVGLLIVAFSTILIGNTVGSLIPTLGLFGVAIIRLQGNITKAVSNFTKLKYSSYAIDIVYDDLVLLDKLLDRVSQSVSSTLDDLLPFKNELRVDSLSFSYKNSDQNVLDAVSLTVPKGSSVGLVGETGAGKSTLINIILGLLEPTDGQITVDGTDIFKNLSRWQPMIGYIPQDIYLLDETIKRNIALGVEDDQIDGQKLRQVAEVAQISDLIQSLPEGWQTYTGERGVRLSGGQRKRIGIARALYHNPDVLVMDEATASLDTTTEKSVMQALNAAKKDRTFIMIAHRLSTVKNCDIIYLLENGRLVSEGTYEHLAEHSETFKQMITDTQ